jgi:hypothetical protein
MSLDELNEIPNHIQKFQNLKILKERTIKQRIHFLNHLEKNCSMGSKCLALDAYHMCKK